MTGENEIIFSYYPFPFIITFFSPILVPCISYTDKDDKGLLKLVIEVTKQASEEVPEKYKLGTSVNIKNLKKATLGKDLIGIMPGEKIELQNPLFEYWLKALYD